MIPCAVPETGLEHKRNFVQKVQIPPTEVGGWFQILSYKTAPLASGALRAQD